MQHSREVYALLHVMVRESVNRGSNDTPIMRVAREWHLLLP